MANGADAVYLGGKAFSARQLAANFDLEELARAVAFCHAHQVKVYVTVNTLIRDEELEAALSFMYQLYQMGVDAVLVQDLGLIRLARRLLPDLPLHASTQMTIHNLWGAKLVSRWGLERVVLARELSRAEVEIICRQAGVEVECFAHGALCFSYSGQCLFSSLVGGRSGNRGRCAQPCRMEYRLVDEEGQEVASPGPHLLSTKDLNLLGYLPELVGAGVRALKIEGRMKRAEYVATVTRIYRQALDRLATGPDHFMVLPEEKRELAQAFNRLFTSAYWRENPGRELMSYQRPNNRGTFLGRIAAVDQARSLAELVLADGLRVGDGIEFWISRGGRAGATVKEMLTENGRAIPQAGPGEKVWIWAPPEARKGDRVFKTYDVALAERARHSTENLEERRPRLWFSVYGSPGQPLSLVAEDERGHRGEGITRVVAQPAQKHPLTQEFLARQLDRLGDTPFRLAGVQARLEGEIMVPVSQINQARRQAVEGVLRSYVSKARRPVDQDKFFQNLRYLLGASRSHPNRHGQDQAQAQAQAQTPTQTYPGLAVVVGSLAAAEAALAAGANRIYLGGEQLRALAPFTRAQQKQAIAKGRDQGAEVVPCLPRIWRETQAEQIRAYVVEMSRAGAKTFMVGNLGGLELVRRLRDQGEIDPATRIWADYSLNVFNAQALVLLAENGVLGLTLSVELNLAQIRSLLDLAQRLGYLRSGHWSRPGAEPKAGPAGWAGPRTEAGVEVELVVHGRLTLMISEHCPVGALVGGRTASKACSLPCRGRRYGLKDRTGLVFPLYPDSDCRLHLLNSKELCLLGSLPELEGLPVSWLRLDVKPEEPGYVAERVRVYRQALERIRRQDPSYRQWAQNREAAWEQESMGGLTRGHYFRGVL